jgi:hypothetical protein
MVVLNGPAYSGGNTYWWAYTQHILHLDQDQDGDGLKTAWELGGYDPYNTGTSPEPLQTYGASPFGSDVFVHVDYMKAGPTETQSHIMKTAAINLAVQEMAKKGINLHIVLGSAVDYVANLGNPGFDWSRDLDPIKNAHFPATRKPLYHYCLFGASYGGGTSSGQSRGIGASDFIVTLGGWSSNPGTTEQQAGTFLHELGHNLGLRHGGNDDTNHKPNFLSIMNYDYQTVGIIKDGVRQFLYSELQTNDLNEGGLNEYAGVSANEGGHTYQAWSCTLGSLFNLNTAVDWNNNHVLQSSVTADINCDGSDTDLGGSPNEYGRLVFNGGAIGSAGESAPSPLLREELTHEVWLRRIAPIEAALPKLDLSHLQQPASKLQVLRRDPRAPQQPLLQP